ncbi:MAG TPA: response regulator [Candidatus Limnocylindria bacterium]|nr:response regulator [Candidatus Limnocylindria bacterium]
MLALEPTALSANIPGPPQGGARPRAQVDGSAAAGAPILVVDDDPEILAMLRDFLEGEGLSVRTASNGAEALDALDELVPSIILLDMRMPVLDGWGFAERLRARQLTYPIVVMTAAESARRWAEEIGANGYIAKPFDVNELLQTIERHRLRDTKPN